MDASAVLIADVSRRMRGIQLPAVPADEPLGEVTHAPLIAEAQRHGASGSVDAHPDIAGRVHVDIGDGSGALPLVKEQVEGAEAVEFRGEVAQRGLPVDGHVFHAGVAPGGGRGLHRFGAEFSGLRHISSVCARSFCTHVPPGVPQASAVDGADCLVHGVFEDLAEGLGFLE